MSQLQIPLIMISIYSAIALLILLWRTRGRYPERTAALLLLGLMAWHCGTRLPFALTLDNPLPYWASYLLLGGPWVLGSACLWFATRYPVPSRRLAVSAIILMILGLTWVSHLLVMPHMIYRISLFDMLLQHQGWFPSLRSWLLVCLAFPVIRLTYEAIHARGYRRLQVRYVLSGVLLLAAGLLMNLFLFVRSTLVPTVLMPLVVQACGIAILAYAFARLPLVNGRVVLRLIFAVGLSIGVTYFFWSSLYPKLVYYVMNFLYQSAVTARILLNVCISFSFLFLLILARKGVDWFHSRLAYDERTVAAEVSRALLQATDSATVVARLSEILAGTIHPMVFGFYLPDETRRLRRPPAAGGGDLPVTLGADDPLLPVLQEITTVQQAELLLQRGGVEEARGRLLMARGIRVVVPLFEDRVWYGCLLLGEKASGDAYDAADRFLLQTISAQASLALENARSHEELEARVAQRTQELAAANDKLREADKAKDRFLALVSHELVNPLASVIGWADIGMRSDDPQLIKRAFEMVKHSGDQQNRLIRDLLDTSRMIHGKLTIQPELSDLWLLVEKTLDGFIQRVEEKQLHVIVLPPEQPLNACVDPERFEQVIANLLSNAIKFSPIEGTITIRGWQDEANNVIIVQDTGKGIPPEKLTSIFHLFQQGADDDLKGGLGLGLALVHGILRLHGGTVTAASPGMHLGSTFTITLPKEYVSPQPDSFGILKEEFDSMSRLPVLL